MVPRFSSSTIVALLLIHTLTRSAPLGRTSHAAAGTAAAVRLTSSAASRAVNTPEALVENQPARQGIPGARACCGLVPLTGALWSGYGCWAEADLQTAAVALVDRLTMNRGLGRCRTMPTLIGRGARRCSMTIHSRFACRHRRTLQTRTFSQIQRVNPWSCSNVLQISNHLRQKTQSKRRSRFSLYVSLCRIPFRKPSAFF